MALFAPAASVGLFESHYYPYLITAPGSFGTVTAGAVRACATAAAP